MQKSFVLRNTFQLPQALVVLDGFAYFVVKTLLLDVLASLADGGLVPLLLQLVVDRIKIPFEVDVVRFFIILRYRSHFF